MNETDKARAYLETFFKPEYSRYIQTELACIRYEQNRPNTTMFCPINKATEDAFMVLEKAIMEDTTK